MDYIVGLSVVRYISVVLFYSEAVTPSDKIFEDKEQNLLFKA